MGITWIGKDISRKEFNLSEKILWFTPKHCNLGDLDIEDVKEFIIKKNRLDMMLHKREINWDEFIERRNKLAGDKLI